MVVSGVCEEMEVEVNTEESTNLLIEANPATSKVGLLSSLSEDPVSVLPELLLTIRVPASDVGGVGPPGDEPESHVVDIDRGRGSGSDQVSEEVGNETEVVGSMTSEGGDFTEIDVPVVSDIGANVERDSEEDVAVDLLLNEFLVRFCKITA